MTSPAPLIAPREGVADALKALLGKDLIAHDFAVGEDSITVRRDAIAGVMVQLRDALDYQQLMEIAGVDYPDRPERFEVVYHLLSVTKNHRLRVRVSTDEATPVPTIVPVRSEEHTSELQSLMRISYAVLCLKKKKKK